MSDQFTTIHTYTRRQAIADGVLIDATAMAYEAGFKRPVAVTTGAWGRCVAVPKGANDQDEAGRLWDVLSMLRFAILRHPDSRGEITFGLYVVQRADSSPEYVELKAQCGPDDDGRPCITVLLPDED